MPCYTLTMYKSQGQTLNSVVLWFDSRKVGLGTGYMALLRIRQQKDLLIPSHSAKHQPRAEGQRARVLISTGI